MPPTFYSSKTYKKRQSIITKTNWQKGKYHTLVKPLAERTCKNIDCQKIFFAKPGNPKQFCSCSCATHTHNLGRKLSTLTKTHIAETISRLPKRYFSKRRVAKIILICQSCQKAFAVLPYLAKKRKYCCFMCAIKTIGSMTTSAKASKGKSGIRTDIDSNICFYSTWEANMARIYNLVNLRWQYAPKTFNLGSHTYRPDFYLPDFNTYVEVKNYLGGYSLERDRNFRQKYPHIKLELILKNDYQTIKSEYKDLVENWEY